MEGVVMMVRGLTLEWKQVLGFFICDNCISSIQLQIIINEAIAALSGVGLMVVAVIMDQGSTQWKWVDNINDSISSQSASFGSQEVFIIESLRSPYAYVNVYCCLSKLC